MCQIHFPPFFFFNVFFMRARICIPKYSFKPDIILRIFVLHTLGLVEGIPHWDLTFILAAHAALCFALIAAGVLVTPGCFAYCWAELTQHQGCLSNPPLRRPKSCRQARGSEGRHWGTWSELTQKIFHTIFIIKGRVGRRREGYLGWWCLPSEGIAMCTNSPLPEIHRTSICLLAWKGE